MRRVLMLGVVATALVGASLVDAAAAGAACRAKALKPLVRKLSDNRGGEYRVWGRVRITGCGRDTRTRFSIYAAERLQPGNWYAQGRADVIPSENAVYYSLPLYLVCDSYRATGLWASAYRRQGRRLRRGRRYGRVCR